MTMPLELASLDLCEVNDLSQKFWPRERTHPKIRPTALSIDAYSPDEDTNDARPRPLGQEAVPGERNSWNREVRKINDDSAVNYPLIAHLLDSAAAAQALFDKWLRPGLKQMIADAVAGGDVVLAETKIAAVAGIHDLGKITPAFQTRSWHSGHDLASSKAAASRLIDGGYTLAPARSENKDLRDIFAHHDYLGLHHLLKAFPAEDDPVTGSEWPAFVVAGHHGSWKNTQMTVGLKNILVSKIAAQFFTDPWTDQADLHREHVLRSVGVTKDNLFSPMVGTEPQKHDVLILITGLIMLADWIASDHAAFASEQLEDPDCELDPAADGPGWVAFRRLEMTRRIVETVGVAVQIPNLLDSVLGKHAASPRQIQADALTVVRGMWIVAEPTGRGKTEAALIRHGNTTHAEGLIFALPTRATANSMVKRIDGVYAHANLPVRLVHGRSGINAASTSAVNSHAPGSAHTHSGCIGCPEDFSFLTGPGKNLIAPITVTTCDQVLKSGIRGRNKAVQLLAIANHHIVLDEVHTYDHYQMRLLEPVLQWCGRTDTRVTLLSATLSSEQSQKLVKAYGGDTSAQQTARAASYPSQSLVDGGSCAVTQTAPGPVQNLIFDTVQVSDQPSSHADWVIKELAANPRARIGVVINRVDHAIEVGTRLRAAGISALVLHSRMTENHRLDVESKLVPLLGKDGNGQGVVVVGTQVIEASLDIDFDLMRTDLAPAASLIQRAGRLWRFGGAGVRAGRIPSSSLRTLVVAAAFTGATLSVRDQLPYLFAEQERTWDALNALPGGLLAIPTGVKELVDAAAFDINRYRKDPAHNFEFASAWKRWDVAKKIVISPPHTVRSTDHLDLVEMTTNCDHNGDDQDQNTRFQDLPSFGFVLLDPSGTNRFASKMTVDQLGGKLSKAQVNDAIGASLKVSGRTLELMSVASAKLLEGAKWWPQSRLLSNLRPVQLDQVSTLLYDPIFGLTRKATA
ncbi:CRISPR-associated helicase Cas3' [Nakamurella antarctica]|uniref:CRISPR-associated helicase Cas3 n=1 Tax=Nakamurella antarctica TaxID=1902245 RepID=A0A3G8ZSR6_9ACTN|nr:CRISPR-associated helicase Cas3' [Nakamurella antarctica]AZI57534.1 CRISPR-associated helicase Cas3' [Nakamurella antarctica]